MQCKKNAMKKCNEENIVISVFNAMQKAIERSKKTPQIIAWQIWKILFLIFLMFLLFL